METLSMEILKKWSDDDGEGGRDYSARVRITNPETKEILEFTCRNIFDFGYVINPNYSVAAGLKRGGLVETGTDGIKRWLHFDGRTLNQIRELTTFEVKCIDYLTKHPPISTEINM